jgi:hypothetical protein
MTRRPLDSSFDPVFPVLVFREGIARVEMLLDPHAPPSLKAGESYLVPSGAERAVQAAISRVDGRPWILRVSPLETGVQRIELFVMNDGYWGGAYVATSSHIRAEYLKRTGPGFVFIAGGLGVLLASLLWALILAIGYRLLQSRVVHPSAQPQTTGGPA